MSEPPERIPTPKKRNRCQFETDRMSTDPGTTISPGSEDSLQKLQRRHGNSTFNRITEETMERQENNEDTSIYADANDSRVHESELYSIFPSVSPEPVYVSEQWDHRRPRHELVHNDVDTSLFEDADETKMEQDNQVTINSDVSSADIKDVVEVEVVEDGETDHSLILPNVSSAFDVKTFLSVSSIQGQELKEVKAHVARCLKGPLEEFQKSGYSVHEEYRRQKEDESRQPECNDPEQDDKDAEKANQLKKVILEARIEDDPRDYQQFLLDIAISRNTIIHLGTGFGKTMIALLCIKHFEGGRTLFLVPSVALANQQAMTLEANLPGYTTAKAFCSNNSGSREHLARSDVMVATHGAVCTQ